MQTRAITHEMIVSAPPRQVFPLLCPTLEYRWLPLWRCGLLHSASGVAEEDCVFQTATADGRTMTWVVSRYEPDARIEFTCFVAAAYVFRLKIAVTAAGSGARLHWTRRWLSIDPAGDAWMGSWSTAEEHHHMDYIGRALAHYLATGEMLPP